MQRSKANAPSTESAKITDQIGTGMMILTWDFALARSCICLVAGLKWEPVDSQMAQTYILALIVPAACSNALSEVGGVWRYRDQRSDGWRILTSKLQLAWYLAFVETWRCTKIKDQRLDFKPSRWRAETTKRQQPTNTSERIANEWNSEGESICNIEIFLCSITFAFNVNFKVQISIYSSIEKDILSFLIWVIAWFYTTLILNRYAEIVITSDTEPCWKKYWKWILRVFPTSRQSSYLPAATLPPAPVSSGFLQQSSEYKRVR